jgi:hypothetical protein
LDHKSFFLSIFPRKTHPISIYKWAPLPCLNSLFPSFPPSH